LAASTVKASTGRFKNVAAVAAALPGAAEARQEEAVRRAAVVLLAPLAGARNSRAAVADSPEAARNRVRHQASSAFRKGRDGSPEGRRKARRMKPAPPQPK